jgi:hypothetical protein
LMASSRWSISSNRERNNRVIAFAGIIDSKLRTCQ